MHTRSGIRRAARFNPQEPVTTMLIESHIPVTFGVVKNISESGLCIVTQQSLALDHKYLFRLSFKLDGTMDIEGQIVWSDSNGAPSFGRAGTCPLGDKWFNAVENVVQSEVETAIGVEFIEISGGELQKLHELLETSVFEICNKMRTSDLTPPDFTK